MLALFLALSTAVSQDPPVPVRLDEPRVAELRPSDALSGSRGPVRVFRHVSDGAGTLYVWTRSIDPADLDLFLRVETADGRASEDDGAGGSLSPCVELEVTPAVELAIHVAESRAGNGGSFELHVRLGRESAETSAACERAARAREEVDALRAAGDHGAARERLRAAVDELFACAGASESTNVSDAGFALAQQAHEFSDLVTAQRAYEHVLAFLRRKLPPEHLSLLTVESNYAGVLSARKDLATAREVQERLLAVYLRTLPPDHMKVQIARNNLGATLHELGQNARARELHEQVLEVFARTLPGDHPSVLTVRLNLANVLFDLRDLEGARRIQEEVLEIRSRTLDDEHFDLQLARQNLANTRSMLGDLEGALALYEKVLAVRERTLEPDHPDLLGALENLAVCQTDLGRLSQAREILEGVHAVHAARLPPHHPNLQRVRQNLGRVLRRLGETERARELLAHVVASMEISLAPDDAALANARQSLALVHNQLGDHGRAEELLRKVVAETRAEDVDALMRHGSLVWTLCALGRRDEAVAEGLRLAGGLRRALEHAASWDAPREAEARAIEMRYEISTLLSAGLGAGRMEPSAELDGAAFEVVESLRGVALAAARETRRTALDPEVADLRARLRLASDEIASRAAAGAPADEVTAAVWQRDALQRELSAALPPAATAVGSWTCKDLATRLERGQAAISFQRYERWWFEPGDPPLELNAPRFVAFVLRADRPLARIELAAVPEVFDAVASWRQAIGADRGSGRRGAPVPASEARPESDERSAGEALRALIFDPLRAALEDVDRLILVRDDVLDLVAFDALPDAAEDRLGDRFRIEVRSTLWELLSEEPPSHAAVRLLALGGIDYELEPSDVSGAKAVSSELAHETPPCSEGVQEGILRSGNGSMRFETLPASAREIESITALFRSILGGEAEPLSGRSATRRALAERAASARFLHLATHGFFASEDVRSTSDAAGAGTPQEDEELRGLAPMLLCGIALAGANRPPDAFGRVAGVMSAEEIAAIDLAGCELAVLSACDTSLGVLRPGQGMASLQRALHMAGARSVVTSSWKVPDEATKELMLDFYRRIWVDKTPKAQALWEAKMALRAKTDARGEPLFSTRDWAAWVLTGNPR